MEDVAGIYLHFKGGKVEVLHIAKHSGTLEEFVVYKALYDFRTGGAGSIWVRPKEMFFEEVEIDGKKVPRFRNVGGYEWGM